MLNMTCFHVRSNNQCLRIDVKMIVMIELLAVMALPERMSSGWVDAAGQGLKEQKREARFCVLLLSSMRCSDLCGIDAGDTWPIPPGLRVSFGLHSNFESRG